MSQPILQQQVANPATPIATLGRMGKLDWANYWRENCAPKLLAKKRLMGRGFPEREIAAYVEAETGKPSGRALVQSWLHGDREPFISQFLALCEKLEEDWVQVLTSGKLHTERIPLRRINEKAPTRHAGSSRTVKKSNR